MISITMNEIMTTELKGGLAPNSYSYLNVVINIVFISGEEIK